MKTDTHNKQDKTQNGGAGRDCPDSSSSPQVYKAVAYEFDDRAAHTFLLDNGDWVFRWIRDGGENETVVRLSEVAVRATISGIYDILKKTGKPIGWIPSENSEVCNDGKAANNEKA